MLHRIRFPTLLTLAAALIAVAILSSGSAVNAAGPPDGNGLDHAIAVQDAHTEELLNIQGVVGTGVGLGADGQPVIVIYAQPAGVAGLPSSLEGVPVDVVVTGMIVALTDPTTRQPRPVPIGVSTGHPDITAGTIGARVTDGTNVFALSNNHVYANTNKAKLGDSALQPGPFDGGEDPADKIGELSDFQPILFDGSDNTIDAAIAISSTDQLGNSTPTDDGYGTPNSTIISCNATCSNLLVPVQKYGRTTGLTAGDVSAFNVTVDVCYKLRGPFFCNPNFIAHFVDQIAITPGGFSAGGDSGSLIVTNDVNTNPVGLLFAGSSTTTFANRIDLVLPRFNVDIDDSAPAADTTPPTVTAVDPADLTTDVAVTTNVSVTFSEPVNGVDSTTFKLSTGGVDVASTVTLAGDRLSATLDPNADLAHETLHTVTVTIGVTDDAGNPMTADFTSSFTTGAVPAPGGAPFVNACNPDNANPRDQLIVTVTGSNFQDGATADFGERVNVQNVTFVNDTQLDVQIKVHPKAASGPRDVTVTNPDAQSGTKVGCFTVN